MTVGIHAHKRLEYRRCHLEYERNDANLNERKAVLLFDNRVYRRNHRLHHVIEQVGETDSN